MAEELNDYLARFDISTAYMHSDVKTLDRISILDDLRAGKIDVLIGVNLLREGLDLPEVSLVAILDADKGGIPPIPPFTHTQTVGRAARNLNGQVIMYADKITESMRLTIEETERRRSLQLAYNEAHGITPQAIVKARNRIVGMDRDTIEELTPAGNAKNRDTSSGKRKSPSQIRVPGLRDRTQQFGAYGRRPCGTVHEFRGNEKSIERLRAQMLDAAKKMDFLEAARLRDEMIKLEDLMQIRHKEEETAQQMNVTPGTDRYLPTSVKEMEMLGWDHVDVVLFSGDAYVDHPSFGAAVIGRTLQAHGYNVAIVPSRTGATTCVTSANSARPDSFRHITWSHGFHGQPLYSGPAPAQRRCVHSRRPPWHETRLSHDSLFGNTAQTLSRSADCGRRYRSVNASAFPL